MTTLALTGLWIAPVSDLSAVLTLRVNGESESVDAPIGVRRYAGGRDRIISRPGLTVTQPFTATNVPRATWLALRDLVSAPCLFRDSRGRAVFGVIGSVSADEWRADPATLTSVSFTVRQVSYSEVV